MLFSISNATTCYMEFSLWPISTLEILYHNISKGVMYYPIFL